MPSKQEIRGLVDGFGKSRMTRWAYCEKHNIGVSTLDYWRRAQKGKPKLVEVAMEGQPAAGFVLVLGNGRWLRTLVTNRSRRERIDTLQRFCQRRLKIGSSAVSVQTVGPDGPRTIGILNVLGWESDGNSPEPFASRTP
jgi:hypothetical protein